MTRLIVAAIAMAVLLATPAAAQAVPETEGSHCSNDPRTPRLWRCTFYAINVPAGSTGYFEWRRDRSEACICLPGEEPPQDPWVRTAAFTLRSDGVAFARDDRLPGGGSFEFRVIVNGVAYDADPDDGRGDRYELAFTGAG